MSKKRRNKHNLKIQNPLEDYKAFREKYDNLEKERSTINLNKYKQDKIDHLDLMNRIEQKKINNKNKREKKKDRLQTLSKIGTSTAEYKIIQYLNNKRISYEKEKEFKDLFNPKTSQPLRFDFYIQEMNLCIEYDGKQHFTYVPEIHGSNREKAKVIIRDQQYRDSLKDIYCKEKDIKLIRLNYKHYYKIEEVLNKELK